MTAGAVIFTIIVVTILTVTYVILDILREKNARIAAWAPLVVVSILIGFCGNKFLPQLNLLSIFLYLAIVFLFSRILGRVVYKKILQKRK